MIAAFFYAKFYLQINLYRVSSSIICLFGEFNWQWISCDESEISFERLATRSTSLCSQLLRHLSVVFRLIDFARNFDFSNPANRKDFFATNFPTFLVEYSFHRSRSLHPLPKIYICKSNGWKIENSQKKKNRIGLSHHFK